MTFTSVSNGYEIYLLILCKEEVLKAVAETCLRIPQRLLMPPAYLILVRLVVNVLHLNNHQYEDFTELFRWLHFIRTLIFFHGVKEEGSIFCRIIYMLVGII